jgi:H+/Cl- antiporter ClcA
MLGEMAEESSAQPNPIELMRSRRFVLLLVLAAVVGVVASLAAWGFLELVHKVQGWAYDDLPDAFGFDSTPVWWSLPLLLIAGVAVAFAIERLPGRGGHLPADGLNPEPSLPIDLPGVVLAAVAGIGLGIVLGPEAPLIALGGGLGFLAFKLLRSDGPPEVGQLVAGSGVFAALSFLFGSPVIAAVFAVEARGIGGPRMPLVLIPGLLAAGIGSLVSIGMGSWTGVDTSAISLEPIPVEAFARPDFVDFLWTLPLAAVIPLGAFAIFRIGHATAAIARRRPWLVVPVVGLLTAGLAILFHEVTDKGIDQVLYSGQESIGPLVAHSASWGTGALLMLIACKGLAYGLALGSFRGGPVFPAMLLAAAAGLLFAELPGYELTPAVAVGVGAGVVAVLRLPLSAVILATLLTSGAGLGVTPLIIVGVVVAYLVTIALPDFKGQAAPEGDAGAGAEPQTAPA